MIVTVRAVSFRWQGMVICGVFIGGMLCEIRYPAKMLPIKRRLIEFISNGLFSLIRIKELKRGCPRSVKNTIRVL